MSDVFISYSRTDDEPFVERLYEELCAVGFDIWWDRKKMPSRARTFLQEIRDAITDSNRLILVVGPKAIKSDYVHAEWEYAMSICKPVIPILRLGDYNLIPDELKRIHSPDFREMRDIDEALDELYRILEETVLPLGKLYHVPQLPAHYRSRPLDLAMLQKYVLADVNRPTVVTSDKQITVLQGMGGIGKSVLAAAFATACETRRAFADAVFWLSIGQMPTEFLLLSHLRAIGKALGDEQSHYVDLDQAETQLWEVLQKRCCLLVLDDVWDADYAGFFKNILGPRCRLLITTRDGGLATMLGAAHQPLDLLSDHIALALLADWVGIDVEILPTEAQQVVNECGNLPLAIAMVGAMVRGRPDRWGNVLHKLQNADLEKIRQQFPNYPYLSLSKVIQVSVESLEPEVREHYLDFAAFPDDVPIPELVLQTYWEPEGLDEYDTQDIVDVLLDSSLARRVDQNRITLHALQFDYIRKQVDLSTLHNRLLTAYRAKCPEGWHTGPDDGYFYQHLPYHLQHAGKMEELHKLLLSFPWLQAKMAATEVIGVLADYSNIRYPEGSDHGIVLSALRMVAPVIRKPSDLAGQIYGHLLTRHSKDIQHFLDSIPSGVPWLRPLNLVLRQAGDAFLGAYSTHLGQIADITILPDGLRVMAVSLNRIVKLLDLENGNEIQTLQEVQAPTGDTQYRNDKFTARTAEGFGKPSVMPAIFVTHNSNFAVCTFPDMTSRVWDLDNIEDTYELDNVTAATASLDGQYLITADHKHLMVRNCVTGEIIQTLEDVGEDIYLLVAMADRARVIIVSYENYRHIIKICNLNTGKVEQILPCGHHDEVRWESWSSYGDADVGGRYIMMRDCTINALALSSNDRFLVSASRDSTLKVWDLLSNEIIHTLSGHSNSVNAVALIPNTMHVLSGSSDESLKIWDIESGQNLRTFTGYSGSIRSVSITPDAKRAVSADRNLWHVWDLRGSDQELTFVGFQKMMLKRMRSSEPPEKSIRYGQKEEPDDIKSIILHPDGKRAILIKNVGNDDDRTAYRHSTDSQFMICELASGAITQIMGTTHRTVNAAVITADGQHIISALPDKTLQISKVDADGESDTLCTHTNDISSVAVTPDGSFILFGSADGTLNLWNIDLRNELRTFCSDKEAVRVVTITPDGKTALSASNELRLWDLDSGKELHTFPGHLGDVTSICVTPDSKLAATASTDATIKVWDLENRQNLFTIRDHAGSVNAIAVTPDGRHIISASDDETIRVWDIKRRELCQILKGHLGSVNDVVVTSDGKHVISVGGVPTGHSVLAWNIETNSTACNLMWHFDSVRAVAISRDGNYAVSASEDKTLKIWDLNQRKAIHILQGHRSHVIGVSITPDGQFIVSGSGGYGDNSIKIWSLENGSLVKDLSGHSGIFAAVLAVETTPDAKHVVSASADETLKVWDIESETAIHTLSGHSNNVNAVAVTADGKYIISASADKTLKVWDMSDGSEIRTLRGHSSFVNAVAVTPDGKYIVSASADGTLKVWDMSDGSEIRTFRGHSSFVNAVAVTPDGKYIVSASADKTLKVWDMDSTEEIASFAAEAGLLCCAISDGGKIVAGDEDGWVYVFQWINK